MEEVYNYKENFPYSFKWNCIDTNITTSKVGILVSKGEALIGEIEFFDENNKIYHTLQLTEIKLIEQYIKPDKSYYSSMFFDEDIFWENCI